MTSESPECSGDSRFLNLVEATSNLTDMASDGCMESQDSTSLSLRSDAFMYDKDMIRYGCYKMDHERRGQFILINNKRFQSNTGMGERTSTDVDASNLTHLFERLEFEVKCYNDLTAYQMLKVMIDAGMKDHSDCDCFAVAVLTHGDEGILYGVDEPILIKNFIQPIKRCLSLAGKPKLFFIEASRGSELDHGIEVRCEEHERLETCSGGEVDHGGNAHEVDSDLWKPRRSAHWEPKYADHCPRIPIERGKLGDVDVDGDVEDVGYYSRIPMEADFLFAYSTGSGYFSWRHTVRGSWFVQALCRVLGDLAFKDVDLLRILTYVNEVVANEFESKAPQVNMTRKKQMPSIVSQLTKVLYFNKKLLKAGLEAEVGSRVGRRGSDDVN